MDNVIWSEEQLKKHTVTNKRHLCADQIVLPPVHPRDITFWGVALSFLSLYFYLAPPQLITLIPSFSSAPPFLFECPALFYHTNFPCDQGVAQGGWVQNNLTGT